MSADSRVISEIVISIVTSAFGVSLFPLPHSLIGLALYSIVSNGVTSVVARLLNFPMASPFEPEGVAVSAIGFGALVFMLIRQGVTITLF